MHAALSVAIRPALCCTNLVAGGQTQVAACNGGAAGSFHTVPALTPPAWPCLYLTALQEALMRALFLSNSKNDEYGCFLLRKA